MITIRNFMLDGQKTSAVTDNPHPHFSFVVDYEENASDIKEITLTINGHEYDVSDLTQIIYEYDDLKPFSDYEAILKVETVDKQKVENTLHFSTGFLSSKWTAPFISDGEYTFKEKKVSPKVLSFRKELNITKKIKKAKMMVTAFGIYNLYINGNKVNEEYFLPGFTSYKHQLQYQTFDISKELKETNQIDVDVAGGWAVGSYVMTRVNRISENKQSLSAVIKLEYKDGSKEEILTDTSWKVTTKTPYLFADIYDGEGFDATITKDNYHQAVIYRTKCQPNILASYGAPVVVKKVLKPKYLHSVDDKDIYDFSQNFAGVLSIKIKNAKQGQVIHIKHAEILNTKNDLNTSFLRTAKCEIKYICKDGEQSYSPTFTYMGFRYISVSGIAKEDIEIEAFVLSSNLEEIGSFECDNKLLTRLNQNIYWSSLSNLFDIPTDCPQRDERMGWTGDICVFAPTALFNFEMTAFLNKWLKDLRSEQLKTGGVPNTIPNQGYGFPVTMPKMAIEFWGDASIMVPYAMYKATGNIEIIKTSYESMKKYVNACLFWARFLSFGDHRYIWHTPSLFHFGDWIAPDVPKMSQWQGRSIYTATCSMANTTSLLVECAELLGKNEDVKKYSQINAKVKKAFNKYLTNGHGVLKEEFQTGYVLPLQFDMFNKEQKEKALKRLVELIRKNNYHIGTGFPGTPYILFALADNGYVEDAYKMLLTDTCPSWLYEVKVGGTTIWERWDGLDENGQCPISDDGTGGMISYNHYASGAVGDFLHSRLAGIKAVEPGYKRIEIKPILCNEINMVKASTISPYGKVSVEYKKNKQKFEITVQIPLRTECNLVLPNGESHLLNAGKHTFSINL